jgi:ABC-2 type transport system permease protein
MKILVIAKKELLTVFRETSGLLFMFMFPIVMLIMFNMIFGSAFGGGGGDNPINLPFIDLDQSELSKQLQADLSASDWIEIETEDSDGVAFTQEKLESVVAKGQRDYAMILPAGFGEAALNGESVTLKFLVDPAVSIQYLGPVEGAIMGVMYGTIMQERMGSMIPERIDSGLDMWRKMPGVSLPIIDGEEVTGQKVFELFSSGDGGSMGFNMGDNLDFINIDRVQPEQIQREEFPSVYQQNLSGYSVLSIFFIITAIGLGFSSEKTSGTFRRVLAAPVSKASYIIGKLLPYIFVNILQVIVLVLLSLLVYKTNIGQSLPAFALVTLSTSLAACGLGLLIVTLFRDQRKMESVSVLVVLLSAALSGAFIPRFVMSKVIQDFSLVVPQSWSMMAFQDVMVRGAGVMDVLGYCGVLLLFATGFFVVGISRFRFE